MEPLLVFTWIVGDESNDGPPVHGEADCVPHWRVNKVELRCILLGVEVSKTCGEDVEIVPVNVDRVVLGRLYVGSLQDKLHSRSVLQLVHLSARNGLPQRAAHIPGVIELDRRVTRKISGENSRHALPMGLQDREIRREHEGHVVHAGRETGPIRPLAPTAWEIARAVKES